MAYVAVSGGAEAIEESIKLLELYKSGTDKDIEVEAVENRLSLLLDRVMGEAGLYAKKYAALAVMQCEGSMEEAVFLLRAYRSTLTRNYCTEAVDTGKMRIARRISAAFKDVPGGQILGATYDYTHRLIDFDISGETSAKKRLAALADIDSQVPMEIVPCPRVSDALKKEGLIDRFERDERSPHDVTMKMPEFPASRSARLQTLARADTGFISGLAYSVLRGFGQVHPTVGELRCGYAELFVPYPGDGGESIYIGEFLMTEVECFNSADEPGAPGKADRLKLSVGYGAAFGRNETKAIAMAVLDHELDYNSPKSAQRGSANPSGDEEIIGARLENVFPARDEEFTLLHGDSLEMNGFISHLKLPHYVTFQSKLDAVRKTRV